MVSPQNVTENVTIIFLDLDIASFMTEHHKLYPLNFEIFVPGI